jgi:hypothetical protein
LVPQRRQFSPGLLLVAGLGTSVLALLLGAVELTLSVVQ